MRSFVFVCSVFVYASTSVHLEKIEVCYGSFFLSGITYGRNTLVERTSLNQ